VFTVDESPWLAERHRYEMQRYSTPLLETHQHYTFQFHDEFAEAIAEGIWLDIADPARPYGRPARHPLAELDPGLPCERFRSASGIEWELRRAPGSDAELVHDSHLCSQRLCQLNLVLDGRSREGASIWLRTRNGHTISRFTRPWPAGELGPARGNRPSRRLRRALGGIPCRCSRTQTQDGPLILSSRCQPARHAA
jgi:hypothetical protein